MTSMTLDPPLTNPLSPATELVAGVDTHKNTHHVAILDHVRKPVADREFRADGRGYAQVVAFLHAHGDVVCVGVEGTGSYGAGLSRARMRRGRPSSKSPDRTGRPDGVGASPTRSTRIRQPSLSWPELTPRSRRLVTGRWNRCGSSSPSAAPRPKPGRR
ncbi:IS110 family transposase [Microbacterium protaetiae]